MVNQAWKTNCSFCFEHLNIFDAYMEFVQSFQTYVLCLE